MKEPSSLTPVEKAIIGALATLATLTVEIGKDQAEMAIRVAENSQAMSEDEKSGLLARTEHTWLQLQQFRDVALKLKDALTGSP